MAVAETRSGRRVMPIFQYRFGHGHPEAQAARRAGDRRPGVPDDGGDRVAPAAGLLRGALAVPVGDGARRARWSTSPSTPTTSSTTSWGRRASVSAHLTTLVNPIETEDCVAASLEMADGSLCTLAVTTGSAQRDQPASVLLRQSLRREQHGALPRTRSDPWTFTGDSPEVDERIQETLAAFVPRLEGYAGQFARYHRALQSGSELPVTLADARASIELITAIYHAARTRAPVRLPLDAAHPSAAEASGSRARARLSGRPTGQRHARAGPSTLRAVTSARIFLLSPAHCGGERARLVLREQSALRPRAPAAELRRAPPWGRSSASERPLLPRQARLRAVLRASAGGCARDVMVITPCEGLRSPDVRVGRAAAAPVRSGRYRSRRPPVPAAADARRARPRRRPRGRRQLAGRAPGQRREREVRGAPDGGLRRAARVPGRVRRPGRHEPRRTAAPLRGRWP